jgi:ATP-dependent 26S proteasome regulatory subunit
LPDASPLGQIEAELRWLSLRLRIVIERDRVRRSLGPPSEYRGLYVADEEVDQILSSSSSPIDVRALRHEAALLRGELDARSATNASADQRSPLDRLAEAFGLVDQERHVLTVALAPHVDRAYEKVYAYANDDVTKKRPTVGLALEILADDAASAVGLRPLFYASAPLVRHGLISAIDEQGNGTSPLIGRPLELDPHIAEVLLGNIRVDPRMEGWAELAPWFEGPSPETGVQLVRVLSRRPNARIYVGGRWSEERRQAVRAGCAEAGYPLLELDVSELLNQPSLSDAVRLTVRDTRLFGAALYFDGWGDGEDEVSAIREVCTALRPLLQLHPLPVIFGGAESIAAILPVTLNLAVELAEPSYDTRRALWQREIRANTDVDEDHLAAAFRLGGREIRAAAEMAQSIADWEGREALTLADLQVAARLQSQPRLTAMARKISPRFSWDDIVLPNDQISQMREIAGQVLHRHTVYDDWNFGAMASLGRGVTALFAGPSGTGKTMAAEIIARELGLDLYKIDLSGLVSKYIGETEKNLSRVFDEAGDTNAILFFDEADAVFGKRTEVRDAHDRYANIEVSYLLQKMDEYDGIVVLATNLRTNIDDAFLRRMRAIVEFPFPEWEDRLQIWRRMLRPPAPIDSGVELEFLAKQFRITGGNIKNIVLLGAFLAAESGGAIAMRHLMRAAKREYQKLGRLVTESDFGGWYQEELV